MCVFELRPQSSSLGDHALLSPSGLTGSSNVYTIHVLEEAQEVEEKMEVKWLANPSASSGSSTERNNGVDTVYWNF